MKKNFLNLGRQPLANSFLHSNSRKILSKEFFYNLNVAFDTKTFLLSVYTFLGVITPIFKSVSRKQRNIGEV